MKQLYFLHIPKTAGKYISKNIKNSLDQYGIKHYISTYYPNRNNFDGIAYISIHAGTYPIELIKNVDVATVVRNPIEARASYFNFIYHKYLVERPEYYEKESVIEKFKYYLFDDSNFELHNNYQSRFLCNPADKRSFDIVGFYKQHGFDLMKPSVIDGKAFTWFVENDNTSLDGALEQISNIKIKSTLEGIDLFKKQINEWFMENYDIPIEFSEDRVNVSKTSYISDENFSSADLINMLTENEKEKILENNSIDYAVYKYVKDIEDGK